MYANDLKFDKNTYTFKYFRTLVKSDIIGVVIKARIHKSIIII